MNICKNCRYWRDTAIDTAMAPEGKHACVRYPPRVIFKKDSEKGTAVFPSTYGEDWCGEWMARE